MHLEIPQLTLLLRGFDLFPQEIELACGGVPLYFSIPHLPISFDNPLPEQNKVVAREGFNFGLNCCDLSHGVPSRAGPARRYFN